MKLLRAVTRVVGRRAAVVVGLFLLVALAVGASSVTAGGSWIRQGAGRDVSVPRAPIASNRAAGGSVIVGHSYKNDRSRPLRLIPPKPVAASPEREASPNPSPASAHEDAPEAVRQSKSFAANMPSTTLNFDGIPFPGFSCNCAPPDTNGEAGATQYVQIVNKGIQVFDKTAGASVYGPADIATLWTGFGGVCENNGEGDPVVLYDQLANRWVVTQFAGTARPTDECIAVSQGTDAAGAYFRYAFHLGNDFFDYPKLGVWPDAYYMSMNVFNSSAAVFLGPQAFAFDRSQMLAGNAATFIAAPRGASTDDGYMPADLDGSNPPPPGAPNPFLSVGLNSTWPLHRFHVDFANPVNSTFNLGGTLTPAPFEALTESVPQLDTTDGLDTLADRGMFRFAYRRFGDGHEALVGNMTVSSGGVGAIRWFEVDNVTSGTPGFLQQSTYQPDSTWRWMASVAMDRHADLAVGFSASSPSIHPQIRYAGRLFGDPPNALAQGEAHLFDGNGSQTDTSGRWGDYSDLTVDPVDDCTFWYTQEYYATTGPFDWRTRIANFKFPSCNALWTLRATKTGSGSGTVVSSPAGINCGGTCSADFTPGVSVTLTATPAVGSILTGWSGGGCSGTGTCIVPMNFMKNVTANFALQTRSVAVVKAGSGGGAVRSSPAGIDCGAACVASFSYGTSMTLTATPSVGSTFTGWSGSGCSGTGTCTLLVTAAKSVTATFALQLRRLAVTKAGTGSGRVTSSPTGINCPSACSHSYLFGAAVTLTARASSGSIFKGWSGACSGKRACVLSMTANRAATARFAAKCVVPKVIGLTLKKAKAKIRKAHCSVGRVSKNVSSLKKKGRVLTQKPKPGKRLKPAAKVNVTVGTGPRK